MGMVQLYCMLSILIGCFCGFVAGRIIMDNIPRRHRGAGVFALVVSLSVSGVVAGLVMVWITC